MFLNNAIVQSPHLHSSCPEPLLVKHEHGRGLKTEPPLIDAEAYRFRDYDAFEWHKIKPASCFSLSSAGDTHEHELTEEERPDRCMSTTTPRVCFKHI